MLGATAPTRWKISSASFPSHARPDAHAPKAATEWRNPARQATLLPTSRLGPCYIKPARVNESHGERLTAPALTSREAPRAATRWLGALACALALTASGIAGGGEPRHAIAMHGEPALPTGFTAFRYVNPDAPKGGRLS